MAVKFGEIETKIRRDILRDDNPQNYRWSVFQVMAAANLAVIDIVSRINSWAGYNQDNGRRIYIIDTRMISDNCTVDIDTLATRTAYPIEGNDVSPEEFVATLRALDVPIDGRWRDAIAYLAASRLLDTCGKDDVRRQKAADFAQMGRELALR